VPPDLERADRLAERLSLLAVIDRVLHRALHLVKRAERGGQSLALEIDHRVIKPPVQFAQQVTARDAAIVEEQFGGVRREVAYLLELLADAEALGLGREEDHRNSFVPFVAGSNREDDEIGARAVGDPQLL